MMMIWMDLSMTSSSARDSIHLHQDLRMITNFDVWCQERKVQGLIGTSWICLLKWTPCLIRIERHITEISNWYLHKSGWVFLTFRLAQVVKSMLKSKDTNQKSLIGSEYLGGRCSNKNVYDVNCYVLLNSFIPNHFFRELLDLFFKHYCTVFKKNRSAFKLLKGLSMSDFVMYTFLQFTVVAVVAFITFGKN